MCEVCDTPRSEAGKGRTASEIGPPLPIICDPGERQSAPPPPAAFISSLPRKSRLKGLASVFALITIILSAIWISNQRQRISAPTSASPASLSTLSHFDSTAVWNPPENAWQTIQNSCRKPNPELVTKCMTEIMQRGGASSEALAFTKLVGDGYMTDFHQTGSLSVATAFHPLRANDNDSLYIINGSPPLIDPNRVSARLDITKDPLYKSLISKYPRVTLWGHEEFQRFESNGAEQKLIFTFVLLNGCHACEVAGHAWIAFEFDTSGRLLGTKLLNLTEAAPDIHNSAAINQIAQLPSTLTPNVTFTDFYSRFQQAINQRDENSLRELMAANFQWALDGYTTRNEALKNIQHIIGWQQFWASAQAAVKNSAEACKPPYCDNRAGYHVWAQSPFPLELLFEQDNDGIWHWTAVLGD